MAKKKKKPKRRVVSLSSDDIRPAVEDKLYDLCWASEEYPLERRIAAWLHLRKVNPNRLDEFFQRCSLGSLTQRCIMNCLKDLVSGRYTISPKLRELVNKL